MPTLEDVKRCPKCGEPGRLDLRKPGPQGSSIHTYICENERCRWYTTGWVVQVGSDGSIPERASGKEKDFPKLTPDQEAFARRQIEDATHPRD